jgi:ABC-type multidrug transport system fused ATPase/permease subunit
VAHVIQSAGQGREIKLCGKAASIKIIRCKSARTKEIDKEEREERREKETRERKRERERERERYKADMLTCQFGDKFASLSAFFTNFDNDCSLLLSLSLALALYLSLSLVLMLSFFLIISLSFSLSLKQYIVFLLLKKFEIQQFLSLLEQRTVMTIMTFHCKIYL